MALSTVTFATLLAVALGAAAVSAGAVQAEDCHEAFLPTDLDLITAVEQSAYREVHLHGEYRIGSDDYVPSVGGMLRNLTLRYATPTQFRMSVSPLDADQLTLTLIRVGDDGAETTASRTSHGGERIERMIFAVLEANVKYNVMMVYSMGLHASIKCPKVLLELAAQPVSHASHFTESCNDDAIIVPAVTPSSDTEWNFEWTSPEVFVNVGGDTASWTTAPDANTHPHQHNFADRHLSVVGAYPLTVPYITGHHNKWKLRALIHANFIDGGDFAFVLTVGNRTDVTPSPRGCARHHHGLQCYYGARAIRNTLVLQEVLWPNILNRTDAQYVLWLVRRLAQHSSDRTCAPIQMKIQLHPLPEQATFINCDVAPLPTTFNSPGMYNNATGVLRFNSDVLVNLTTREQKVTITPTKTSLMRAWVGAHNEIDIDLLLYDMSSKQLRAASMAMSGPEGIVWQLNANVTYALSYAVFSGFRQYTSTDHDYVKYCDSFETSVHVFPLVDSTDDGDCSTRAPELGGVQTTLNATKGATFGLTDSSTLPFSYAIDVSQTAKQLGLLNGKDGLRLYLPKTAFFFALVTANSYGGTPQLTLTKDGSSDVKYSKPRTVGSAIYGQLQQGWYTLRMMTPYVQSTSKLWSEISSKMPSCVRYNFKLRVDPDHGCLQELAIPAELTSSLHGHHHLFDEYHIPSSGTASLTLKPTRDSTIHVQIQDSDAPVRLALHTGDISDVDDSNLLATSHRIVPSHAGDSVHLFVNLAGDSTYTLLYNFDLAAAPPSECKSMMMQLSLIPTPPPPPQSKCKTIQGSINLGPIAPPLDSNSLEVIRSGVDASARKPAVIVFNLTVESHFRASVDLDFTTRAMGGQICPCANPSDCLDDCGVAFMYFNGFEYPSKTLRPGVYSMSMYPWTSSMITGRDLEHDCSRIQVRLALAPVGSRQAPQMCPRRMQYLPASLNTVGILSRHYKHDAHFLQLVRVNTQHYTDQSQFTLKVPSIVRVSVPGNGYQASVRILSADRKTAFGMGTTHTTVVMLDPGSYVLIVTFAMRWSNYRIDSCLAVPLEFSVIPSSDVPKLAVAPPGSDATECNSVNPMPTAMAHHGHDTMYHAVNRQHQFKHTINFTVGSAGAFVEVDLRYNFQVAGLAATMQLVTADDSATPFTFGYYADRSYLARALPAGQYQLEIYDPVWAYPINAPLVSCTPWSLHLREYDALPPAASGPPATSPNGVPAPPPTPRPTVRPTLDCFNYAYTALPTVLDRRADSPNRWFSLRGRHFEIPYSNGAPFASGFSQLPTFIAYRRTSLVAFPGDVIRVWMATEASASSRVRLYMNNQSVPVAHGLQFGRRTRSLTFAPSVAGSSANITVEISFIYTVVPQYRKDYTECWTKQRLTSFEMYVSVFPRQRLLDAASCDGGADEASSPTPTAAPAHTELAPAAYTGQYPPSKVILDKPLRISSRMFYFTRSDCKLQEPQEWQTNAPNAAHSNVAVLMTRSTFWSVITCKYTMNVTVPANSLGVFFSAEVKYSMLLSDLRATLTHANGTMVRESVGGPTTDADERYNAETDVHAWGLVPGDYSYTIEQSFASRQMIQSLAAVCVPFELDLNLGGSVLGSITSAPSLQGPRVIQVLPATPLHNVDPSQRFRITVNVDHDFDISFRPPSGVYPAALKDLVTGNIIKPSGRYFESPTRLITTYNPGVLQWKWPYEVVLTTAAMRTVEFGRPYSIAVDLPTISTASCSCDQGACAVGGACGCHALGSRCDVCPDGTQLSPRPILIGPTPTSDESTSWPSMNARVCRYPDVSGPARQPPPAQSPPTPAPPQHGKRTPAPARTDAPPVDAPPPAPPVSPGNNGPSGTSVPVESTSRPPLKLMRVLMSASALLLMMLFAGTRIAEWMQRRSRAPDALNPFRRVAQDDDADGGRDDDGDDDEDQANAPHSADAADPRKPLSAHAGAALAAPVPATTAKASVSTRRGQAARHVAEDDEFAESDSIVERR